MIDYNYPTAFLGEAVQKNLLITDGTVTVSGDTYTVTGDTVTITNSELETEAFELHQSINSDMQLRFGSCESAYISFVFRKTNITTLIGKTLKVYIIPNHEASKILQLGVFKVQTDKLSYDGTQRQITAYDAMYDIINSDVTDWYNTQFPNATSTKYLGVLVQSFIDYFGLTVDGSVASLPNGTKIIRRTIDPEQLSGSDVIRAMCEINGVFGRITNEGKFKFDILVTNIRSADPLWEIPVTQYMDIHFDDYDSKMIDALRIITDKASETYNFASSPTNIYTISGNFLIADYDKNEIRRLSERLKGRYYNHYYTACTVNALGNPVLEPGDPIKVITKNGETYTYILERHMRGVQALRDTYTAHGEEYSSESLNSISSRFSRINSEVSRAESSGSITADANFVEIIRNIGFRLLDEPTVTLAEYDEANVQVSLKWTDPSDIATDEPVPATWAGTVVVRKEGSAPLHRWDGTLIVNSTTRDEYSSNALVDSAITDNKSYYYGIFPYDTKGDYRYTKIIVINGYEMSYPDILSLVVDHTSITVNYEIPTGYTWSQVGIVYKKGSAPADKTDGTTVDITGGDGSEEITGLDENSTYYFRIFSTEQSTSREFLSNAQSATTGEMPAPVYRCLASITVGGVVKPLLQIDDFSIIPNTIKEATSIQSATAYARSLTPPSFVTADGTDFYNQNINTMSAAKVVIAESQYLSVEVPAGVFSFSGYSDYNGMRIYNKIAGNYVQTLGWSDHEVYNHTVDDNGYREHFIGVVLEETYHRGYLLIYDHMAEWYSENMAPQNGYRMLCFGGKVGDIDYVYETFKNM